MDVKIADWVEKFLFKKPLWLLFLLIVMAFFPEILSSSIVENRYPNISVFLSDPENRKWDVGLSVASLLSFIIGILLLSYLYKFIRYCNIYRKKRVSTVNVNTEQEKLIQIEAVEQYRKEYEILMEKENKKHQQEIYEKEEQERLKREEMGKKIDNLTNPAKYILGKTFGSYPNTRGDIVFYQYGCEEQEALEELIEAGILRAAPERKSHRASRGGGDYSVKNEIYDLLNNGEDSIFKQLKRQKYRPTVRLKIQG